MPSPVQQPEPVAVDILPANDAGIDRLRSEMDRLTAAQSGAGPHDDETLRAHADALTRLLRWDRRYDAAIDLQRDLARMMPERAGDFRIIAATLRIEAGEVEAGIADLSTEIASMPAGAGQLLLGSTYAWLQRFDAARDCLSLCAVDPSLPVTDRAEAHFLLFRIHVQQRRLPEAKAAWQAAVDLDPERSETLSELIRAHIYWYDYDGARALLPREASEVRRSFLKTMIESRSAPDLSRSHWDWIAGSDPKAVDAGHEEIAEAALRNADPRLALDALGPLLEAPAPSRTQMVLAGLAWAQQRNVERAQWALSVALRLAEFERPRLTRPGARSSRIFDAATRMIYGEVPIDMDIRAYLDAYFMPKPPVAFVPSPESALA